jgi:hypothetical protein
MHAPFIVHLTKVLTTALPFSSCSVLPTSAQLVSEQSFTAAGARAELELRHAPQGPAAARNERSSTAQHAGRQQCTSCNEPVRKSTEVSCSIGSELLANQGSANGTRSQDNSTRLYRLITNTSSACVQPSAIQGMINYQLLTVTLRCSCTQ